MKRLMVAVVALLFVLGLNAPKARALVNEYVEDFSSKQYCNTVTTTADWDTLAGEIRLWPFELQEVGSYSLGTANAIAVEGDYAFVCNGGDLSIVDIGDPAAPSVTGTYTAAGLGTDIAMAGNYAYIVEYSTGVHVIDVTSPTSPSHVGSEFISGATNGIAVSGDHAYVVADGGLVVVDIGTPTSPTSLSGASTPGTAHDVAIAGDYAFVAALSSGLQVIDISDDLNPTLIPPGAVFANAFAVALSGDHAFVATGSGLTVVDITDPTAPSVVGSVALPDDAVDVAVDGDFAYLACPAAGLCAVDIRDPEHPVLLETLPTVGPAGVAVSGKHAFLAESVGTGFASVRICHAARPSEAGSQATPGSARALTLGGDHAYLADYEGGLQVIDIRDPSDPWLAGGYTPIFPVVDVAVAGDYAFVTETGLGLEVIDISDPASPSWVAMQVGSGVVYGLAVEGDYLYMAEAGDLRVQDISDPERPVLEDVLPVTGTAFDVAVSGNYAYVAAGAGGAFSVIDISDPTIPSVVTELLAGDARGIVIQGDFAYLADYSAGLVVIDIGNPAAPTLVAEYATPGNPEGLWISGNFAFLADGGEGLQVFDITDPYDPQPVSAYDAPGWAYGVAVGGDYAFVADDDSGIQVVEVFQRSWDPVRKLASSKDIEPGSRDVTWAKLSAVQSDSIRWQLTADGGTTWGDVPPNGTWSQFGSPGHQLKWRSIHEYAGGGVNPTCTDLEIDWLYDFPVVNDISDVGNDQGLQVSISWTRSGYDYASSPTPITQYAVYRRIDEVPSRLPASDATEQSGLAAAPAHGSAGQTPRYPPGEWHFVAAVPAFAEDSYSVVVPTLADSSISQGMHYSVFFVRAATATPAVYFDSPPDSGYSIDNLAPFVPAGFAVDYNATENHLTWEESVDEDFQYFRIYRGTDPDFVHAPDNLVHATIDVQWVDEVTEGWLYYYKITAVDFSGNESDPASPETVTGVEQVEAPSGFVLYQNAPNPLNPATTIRYDVPSGGGTLTLDVFDAAGRLVRRLVDTAQAPGRKSVVWDGTDDHGDRVSSGVYYYRLVAPGYEKTLRMILVK